VLVKILDILTNGLRRDIKTLLHSLKMSLKPVSCFSNVHKNTSGFGWVRVTQL